MNKIRKNFVEIFMGIFGIFFIIWIIFNVSSCTKNAMDFPLPTPVIDINKGVSTKLFALKFKFSTMPGNNIKEAIEEMDKEGYRPATLEEGWAFLDTIPDEDKKEVLPINCLGDVRWSFPFSFHVGVIKVCGFGEYACGGYEADIAGGTGYHILGVQK
jgi:hypothetical protein